MSKKQVLVIGNDKDLFTTYSVSARRQVAYAGNQFELHIVVFSHKKLRNKKTVISDSVHVYPTNATNPLTHIVRAFSIASSILRVKRDQEWVISTQDPFESGLIGYVLSKLFGIPLQVQEHGDFYSTDDWRDESVINRCRYAIGRFVLPRATQVRVVSSRIQKTLTRFGVPVSHTVCFPVVTHVDEFRHTLPRQTLSEKTSSTGPFILWVGRMVPQKNLGMLVRAFAKCREKVPDAKLVLVGSGSDDGLVKKEIERLHIPEYVFLYPWSDDVASLYKTADVYALSSNYEGWARVVIESLACELPVVMTDVGCAGEVVVHRETGSVVPVHDEDVFAQELVSVLSDATLRDKYKRNSRNTMASLITEEQAVMATRNAWNNCVQSSTKSGTI